MVRESGVARFDFTAPHRPYDQQSRIGAMLLDLVREVKYAIRSFARRPLLTGVILLTLGLGIGSNVAIFSVANTVLFRELPFEDPEELAFVWTRLRASTGNAIPIRYIGRPERASPAEGYHTAHAEQQARIVSEILAPATGREVAGGKRESAQGTR